jgi:hypothetical protein
MKPENIAMGNQVTIGGTAPLYLHHRAYFGTLHYGYMDKLVFAI